MSDATEILKVTHLDTHNVNHRRTNQSEGKEHMNHAAIANRELSLSAAVTNSQCAH